MNITNPKELAEKFIHQTSENVFLTGKAGTGKTTLLKSIVNTCYKNTVVAAPTGIAALNAGGVTLNSLFQLPFGAFLPTYELPANDKIRTKITSKANFDSPIKLNSSKKSLLRSLELLIIDEVSMLRADMLDAIDFTLQKVRRNDEPFGGVQVLFIGDLYQLPPVVKREEYPFLNQFYKSSFFFDSLVLIENPPIQIELEKIYRQSDPEFIRVLNNFRNNELTLQDSLLLNKNLKAGYENDSYITLTTHNAKADRINTDSLAAINNKSFKYKAEIVGDFPENIFPIPEDLSLKMGAKVMFIKNDSSFEKLYFNGKMGTITSLSEEEIEVETDEGMIIKVEKYTWENIKFEADSESNEIKEDVVGTFTHYPLKLAWAITIHKSQGLTFDKAIIDISEVFATGQAYVALSRLRTLSGLILKKPIDIDRLKVNYDVVMYSQKREDKNKLINRLEFSQSHFLYDLLIKSFDWSSFYLKYIAFLSSSKKAERNSEKSEINQTFKKYQDELVKALDTVKNFRNLIKKICNNPKPDLIHLEERVSSAVKYFLPIFEKIFIENSKAIFILQGKQGVKKFVEELSDLANHLRETITKILKAEKITKLYAKDESLNKESLNTKQISEYFIRLMEKSKLEFQKENPSLIDRDFSFPDQKVKVRKGKQSTEEKTYDLLKSGMNSNEIAVHRNISERTVISHFEKLIEKGIIDLEEVMPKNRERELLNIIGDYKIFKLKDAKEKFEELSYDELKLIRATQIASS